MIEMLCDWLQVMDTSLGRTMEHWCKLQLLDMSQASEVRTLKPEELEELTTPSLTRSAEFGPLTFDRKVCLWFWQVVVVKDLSAFNFSIDTATWLGFVGLCSFLAGHEEKLIETPRSPRRRTPWLIVIVESICPRHCSFDVVCGYLENVQN